MGLGSYMKTWQRQTKDFGHTEADKYTCLIFDNRGMGESDKPILRYTTSEMAKDIVELLDHVGWTEPRSVHVVGISMGGMISQELVRCSLFVLEWRAANGLIGAPNPRENLQSQSHLHCAPHCPHPPIHG